MTDADRSAKEAGMAIPGWEVWKCQMCGEYPKVPTADIETSVREYAQGVRPHACRSMPAMVSKGAASTKGEVRRLGVASMIGAYEFLPEDDGA